MKSKRLNPEAAAAANRRDRNRMIMMAAVVVILAIGYFAARSQRTIYSEAENADLPDRSAPQEASVVVPVFDTREVLASVHDATPEERLILEAEALDTVFDYGRLFTRGHFESVGIRDLEPDVLVEIELDPAKHRVEAFRARGEILGLKQFRRSENRPIQNSGTLRLDDGSFAHFVVLEMPEGAGVGDFVRVDGMFLKLYSTEGPEQWWEGPLICGPKASPSYPLLDIAAPIDLHALEHVSDDSLDDVSGLPEDAEWALMARALRELELPDESDVDWEAAPELDSQIVGDVFTDGAAYRGQPFRLAVSRNLGGWTEDPGENPLRLDKITTGWVGNQLWKGEVAVIHYIAPFDKPELDDRYGEAKFLTGRGFFFKNMAYTRSSGDLGRVPVFVMSSVDVFFPAADVRTRYMLYGVAGGTAVLVAFLFFLLMRDKKQSGALQAELVRRRQERRARLGEEGKLATGAEGSSRQ